LTAKQAAFVMAYAKKGLSLTEAYRRAYPPRSGARQRQTEWSNASRLQQKAHVAWAIEAVGLRTADTEAVRDPEAVRREALIGLRKIRKGRLDPARTRAIEAELRQANRALRERARADRLKLTECRKEAWRRFIQACGSIEMAHRAQVSLLSPEERTRRIFAILAPRPADLARSPDMPHDPEQTAELELQEYVRSRQLVQAGERTSGKQEEDSCREAGYAAGSEPVRAALAGRAQVIAALPVPAAAGRALPAGEWRFLQVPGFFPPRRRRVWVPAEELGGSDDQAAS
jgi:hypothetical protein